jgi:carnosine N-methyltransferase
MSHPRRKNRKKKQRQSREGENQLAPQDSPTTLNFQSKLRNNSPDNEKNSLNTINNESTKNRPKIQEGKSDCSKHEHDYCCHHSHSHGFDSFSAPDDSNDDPEKAQKAEREHFANVIQAFLYYNDYTQQIITKMENDWNSIPEHHRKLLPEMPTKFKHWRMVAIANAHFISCMIQNDRIFENQNYEFSRKKDPKKRPTEFNMEKVRGTIKQFVREWSTEGEEERNSCYKPILNELERHFPITENNKYTIRVLSPGSGLGRLPFEICKKGYISQGNEYSYFMLIASNFVLNRTKKANEYTIYPHIHQVSNVLTTKDQLRPITIPDVFPGDLPPNADFSYTAGDFLEVYRDQFEQWDAVCTCFFIDTANNIIEYVEQIYKILKPGGVWINLGPLLYHFSDIPHELSIELTYEQLIRVVRGLGFQVENEEFIRTTYTANSRSMLQNVYQCVKFTAIKPEAKNK